MKLIKVGVAEVATLEGPGVLRPNDAENDQLAAAGASLQP